MMEIYPAVDVQGGRVVRAATAAAPPPDPLTVAAEFARAGARWVHFVDLDRAYGRGDNRDLARALLAAATIPVQVGGGLHSEPGIAEMLRWGASRVVIGAKTAIDAVLVDRLLGQHGPKRLAVGIDARDGQVAPRGTTEVFDVTVEQLGRRVRAQGARTVIYTDVARDGMLTGPDVAGAVALAALGLEVIASGGIASLEDLRTLHQAGIAGAIVGRALHEARFTLGEALECVR
jgi:phosphoribosylformimino-5-aminoimidazole carboxamide ribotide isomerase